MNNIRNLGSQAVIDAFVMRHEDYSLSLFINGLEVVAGTGGPILIQNVGDLRIIVAGWVGFDVLLHDMWQARQQIGDMGAYAVLKGVSDDLNRRLSQLKVDWEWGRPADYQFTEAWLSEETLKRCTKGI